MSYTEVPCRPRVSASWVARWLGVTEQRVYQLVRSGKLPHFRLGKRIYFSPEVLEEFSHTSPVGSTTDAGRR